MENVVETKKAVVAKVANGMTIVVYVAMVDGDPSEAQIETGRNALAATLEIVGAAATSAYLMRFAPVDVQEPDALILDVDAALKRMSPGEFSETLEA